MTKLKNLGIEQIDQLRAGLLDDAPQLKEETEAALVADKSLAMEHSRWEQIRQQLDKAEDSDIRLKNQLRLRRRSVLSGKAGVKKSRRFTLPQMALATVASVAVTLSAVLWLTDYSLTAVIPGAGYDSASGIVYSTTPDATGEFDLTNNIDFYTWMEHQSNLFTEVPDNGT